MTIDWFVWFTPLILLPIVALFVFVGCTFDASGFPWPSRPDLMLKTKDLHSTAWFRARWTFFKANSSVPLGVIMRPDGVTGKLLAAGNPYQLDDAVEAKTSEPDFIAILALAPDLVQCECIVLEAGPGKQPVTLKVTSGPEQQSYQPGTATKMIWVLSRDPLPGLTYHFEAYQYV